MPLAQGHALVVAVLELFLELARPDQTRMRHLLAETSVNNFLRQLNLPLQPVDGFSRHSIPAPLHLGSYPQRQKNQYYVAAVAPLGRLDSAMLRGAAQLAVDHGDATLRVTPWQGLLLPNIRDATAVIERLERLGFLCSVDQPLARLIACTGSSGCAKGLADTKQDARHLAPLAQAQGSVAPPCRLARERGPGRQRPCGLAGPRRHRWQFRLARPAPGG